MPSPRLRRLPIVLLLVVLAVVLLGLAGSRLAAGLIRSHVVEALGPRGQVGSIDVGLASVTLHDVRIAGAPADEPVGGMRWPDADELRARTVRVTPGWRSLWSAATGGPWVVERIAVEDGFLAGLRTRDGRLHLVPSLTAEAASAAAPRARRRQAAAAREQPGPEASVTAVPVSERQPVASASTGGSSTRSTSAAPVARVVIEHLDLSRCTLELHDASLKTPRPHVVRFRDLHAAVGPLALPGLAMPVQVDLGATLQGVEHEGTISLQGRLTPATLDADLALRVRDADLVALQPYLFSLNEGGVRHGRLDLSIDAQAVQGRLHAPGSVTLTGLELARSGDHLAGGLGALARQALVDLMARRGHLTARFTLDGRLDDPAFSLNEHLAARLVGGLADSLGMGVEGVVQGMGQVLKGLVGR